MHTDRELSWMERYEIAMELDGYKFEEFLLSLDAKEFEEYDAMYDEYGDVRKKCCSNGCMSCCGEW